MDDTFLQIKIARCQSKKLTHTESAPIKHFESVEGNRLVHNLLDEARVLFLCPKEHFSRFFLAHISCLCRRVACKLVVANSVIEYRAELIVDRFQIGGRVSIAVLIPIRHDLFLPSNHIRRLDIAHALVLKIGEDLLVDHACFHNPSAELESVLQIFLVKL